MVGKNTPSYRTPHAVNVRRRATISYQNLKLHPMYDKAHFHTDSKVKKWMLDPNHTWATKPTYSPWKSFKATKRLRVRHKYRLPKRVPKAARHKAAAEDVAELLQPEPKFEDEEYVMDDFVVPDAPISVPKPDKTEAQLQAEKAEKAKRADERFKQTQARINKKYEDNLKRIKENAKFRAQQEAKKGVASKRPYGNKPAVPAKSAFKKTASQRAAIAKRNQADRDALFAR